jgi:hypothetical protein
MMGSRRREVTSWYFDQKKFKIMFSSHADAFQVRDVINEIAVGNFDAWEQAAEYAWDLQFDTLSDPDG